MRLDELTIGEFKNLHNLHVKFATAATGSDESSPYTVLVGENGAGKSNLLEALTYIFRNLDIDAPAPFAYALKYHCRGHHIEVSAEKQAIPKFWLLGPDGARGTRLPRREFMALDADDKPLYRPAFVFGYYSGPSDRLAGLYEHHRERYYRRIIKPEAQSRPSAVASNALRRLFYAQNLHGQFALLAFFMDASSPAAEADREFLRDTLQIDGLDSVLFALRKPPWKRAGGDPRFWHAEGEVRAFLSKLYDVALSPVRMSRRIPVDLTKNPSVECLYLFLPNPEALAKVYASYTNQYAFFTALESTYISKVLGEVRTRVRMTHAAGGGEITYRELSEGEQQLLLVLGLLKFTAEDEALFLLDEPDTHLNPLWSTQYLGFLDRFIQGREGCQVIMSTHDPLVFAGLKKAQVRVLRRGSNGEVIAEEPLLDPRGMGIQAILTSDLFRLRTTLDPDTQRDLDRQRELSTKPGDLSAEEQRELRDIRSRLQPLGFWKSDPDPMFALFQRKWTERAPAEPIGSVELTHDEIVARERLAEEIVAELAAEQGAER